MVRKMSQDNSVVILELVDAFLVSLVHAPENLFLGGRHLNGFLNSEVYENYDDAKEFAEEMDNELNTEYGVIRFTTFKNYTVDGITAMIGMDDG
jgi:hypothetical protein